MLITKFLAGAWIAILAMCVFFLTMKAIRKHYDRVGRRARRRRATTSCCPAGSIRSSWSPSCTCPTLRACYARATRPDLLEAVTVNVDPAETAALAREWEARQSRCR